MPLGDETVDRQLVDGNAGLKKPCSTLLNCPCAECAPAMAVSYFRWLANKDSKTLYHARGTTSIRVSRIQTRPVSPLQQTALMTFWKQQAIMARQCESSAPVAKCVKLSNVNAAFRNCDGPSFRHHHLKLSKAVNGFLRFDHSTARPSLNTQ